MSAPKHNAPAFGGRTILVVDDQAQIRSLIRQALEPYGATILEASNGYEALTVSRRRQGPISLAMIDFMMPGLSGLDLAAELGRDVPDLKILYMSSAVESIAIESLLRRSPGLVLSKPFTLPELLQRICSLLGEQAV